MRRCWGLLAGGGLGRGSRGLFRATPIAYSGNDDWASVTQLRQRLRQQISLGVPRMASIDTESRLVIELSRSPRSEERQEALDLAEDLWKELNDWEVPIMTPTRTAMRVNLCSAMRRCALVSRERAAADTWTARFAERATRLSPTDFIQAQEHQAAWKDPRAAASSMARPGTGITQEDLDADAQEAAEANGGAAGKQKQKRAPPMQEFKREVFLDHPSFEYAFRHGKPGSPGPRYTG